MNRFFNFRVNNMLKILVLLIVSTVGFSQNLMVVSDPDVAERGWYWLPDEPGWGLNIDIQPVSWNETGHYMFGTIFTYDDEGNPFWYTFQGDYVPNGDVYAWREGRGLMGSFTSPLYQTQGGNSPIAPYQAHSADVSALGNISIDWKDPLHATMSIGNVTKEVVYQYYHAGLNGNDANFVTDGGWYVQGSFGNIGFKGFTKFEPLDLSIITNWDNANHIDFSENYQWFYSVNNKVINMSSSSFLTNINSFVFSFFNEYILIAAYDSNTNKVFIFPLFSAFGITGVSVCSNESPQIASGLLRPAVGSNTRLYFSEGEIDNCDPSTYTNDEKRQVFVSLTRIPQGGDDLAQLHGFQNNNN